MTKRNKLRPLTAAKLVREKARAQVGPVPPTKMIADKRRRPQKHKADLEQQQ